MFFDDLSEEFLQRKFPDFDVVLVDQIHENKSDYLGNLDFVHHHTDDIIDLLSQKMVAVGLPVVFDDTFEDNADELACFGIQILLAQQFERLVDEFFAQMLF